jgi:hypothetical protein
MKSAFEQIRVLLELKEKGSISEEEFKQMLAILENESTKDAPKTAQQNKGKEPNPVEDYQESVQKMEQVLDMLIHNGRLDEARQRFEKFPFKSSINERILSILMESNEPKEKVTEQASSIEHDQKNEVHPDVEQEEKPIQTDFIPENWKSFDTSEQKPFYKRWTKKQWLFSILCLFLISYFTKIPHFIWDKDADGVYNWSDVCPDIKGSEKSMGCPDKDNDGITDNLDLSSSDNDGDQIPNIDDQCPDVWGSIVNHGCPGNSLPTKQPKEITKDVSKGPINTKNYPVLQKVFGLRFIKLVGSHYEVSQQEFKGYKKITDKTQITALNKEFGLNFPGGAVTNKTGTTPLTGNANRDLQTFPPNNLMKAKMALNDLKYVSNLSASQKEDLNKKIQSIGDDYFGGVISGKYQEDKVINKELSTILKEKNVLLTTKTNPSTSTKKEFPDKAKAQSTFSNWEKETEPAKKAKFRKEFLNFKDNYYKGVTTGKYAEDGAFEKFIQKSMKKIGNFSN